MKLIDFFRFGSQQVAVAMPTVDGTKNGPRAVVAFGGGGARGLAHLGAMEVISDSGFQTERIVGVSIGSLAGAMCALEPNVRRVQSKALNLLDTPTFQRHLALFRPEAQRGYFAWLGRAKRYVSAVKMLRRAASAPSLFSGTVLRELVDELIPDIDLADLPVPLSIVAADLRSGHRIVLERGSLREAVMASTAIPGFFPPVRWGNALLCDIGVIDSLAATVAQSYATDLTISVDVSQHLQTSDECNTALDVMMRMQEVSEQLLRRKISRHADCIIRPDVGHTPWFDFSQGERLIEAGRRAARRSLAQLHRAQTR